MAKPRVLMLDHTAQVGGAEIALLRLIGTLRSRDTLDLRVLLFADGPLRGRLAATGVPTVVLRLEDGIATAARDRIVAGAARSAFGAVRFALRLARGIRGSRADLVVANSLKSAAFAFVAAPLAGRPWVWHLHDRLAPDYLPRPLVTAMHLVAALGPRAIIANSRATLETLPARARRRATVAYPGLPPEAFARATTTPSLPMVGIVGRISPTKGQREFLLAAATLAEGRPDVRFAVIGGALFGEDEYAAELRELARSVGLADRIEFTGWVADAAEHLRGLSLVVHSSPVPEPFGQVVVEAMAAGIPVIATAAGGVPDILDPLGSRDRVVGWRSTSTGVLVAPGDPAALAAAMAAVLAGEVDRAGMAEAAFVDAANRFTIERTADEVVRVWGRQLSPSRAGAEATCPHL